MNLRETIKQQITDRGPISFHDFMDMALYYPGLGYYTALPDKIGKNGDYYTSPYLSSLFAEMIGRQLEEMWNLLNKQPFAIIEYGAGNAMLCYDILNYLKQHSQFYEGLNYYIIEKNNIIPHDEKNIFPGKIKRIRSVAEIGQISGCILSNELVDNFPVHRVVMEDELMEVFVDHKDDFVEIRKPAMDELKGYFAELNVRLPRGFMTEVNLQAKQWIEEISSVLKKGFVMTIDYGYRSSELYEASKRLGTIMCYHKHRVNEYPYQNIGEQDITAFVNFSALSHFGAEKGLDYCGYSNQAEFLLSLGLVNHIKEIESRHEDPAVVENKMAALSALLMDMGKKFKVLIQQKGISKALLSGMRFAPAGSI